MKEHKNEVVQNRSEQGRQIVFDDRVQADSPRTAREQMKCVLGLQSLTGVVYSITEIPVELIKELVNARVAEVVLSRNGRSGNVNLEALIGSAVTDAVGARLRPIEQRLGALESRGAIRHYPPAVRRIPTRIHACKRG